MKKLVKVVLISTALLLQVNVFAQTVLLMEDFSSGTLPSGWMNDSIGGTATFLWEFNNPAARQIMGSNFDTSFVILDSDHYGIGNDQQASLTTAAVSAVGFSSLTLSFDEQYFGQSVNGSLRTVEASGDSGMSWFTLVSDSASVGYPVAVRSSFNLDTLAGSSNVMIRFTYSGSWDYWWGIDNVLLTALIPCSAPPIAGKAVTTHNSVCAGNSFALSLQNDSVAAGLSYQWQFSTDSLIWSDIPGATQREYNTSQGSAKYYRCYLTCSGQSDTSIAISVNMNASSLCYCVPSGTGCSNTNFITKVSIPGTTLSHVSSCQENDSGVAYVSYPVSGNTTTTLFKNSSYVFEINSAGSNFVSLWIDFDHSGTFDSVEWRQVAINSVQGVADTITVSIPDSINRGLTAIRVRTRAAGNTITASDACTVFASGETEDYYITIDTLLSATQEIPEQKFNLFPNPASSRVTISLPLQPTRSLTLAVRDILGKVVLGEATIRSGEISVDISTLKQGVYFVQLIGEGYASTQRLVVTGH